MICSLFLLVTVLANMAFTMPIEPEIEMEQALINAMETREMEKTQVDLPDILSKRFDVPTIDCHGKPAGHRIRLGPQAYCICEKGGGFHCVAWFISEKGGRVPLRSLIFIDFRREQFYLYLFSFFIALNRFIWMRVYKVYIINFIFLNARVYFCIHRKMDL